MIIPTVLQSLLGLSLLSHVVSATNSSLKVAIIGAGAGGSSASFWLSLAHQRSAPDSNLSVTVYEKNNRVGGRSTTVYPYNDTSYAPIELGASIFTADNLNMYRAASEFGTGLVEFDAVVTGTGIWDGKQFVWRTTDNSTDDDLRMAARYGNGPAVSGNLIANFTNAFEQSYTPSFPQWKNISAYAASVGYTPLETVTLQAYLDANGVNKLWTREFMSGSSRFNYGQDAEALQAVAGMASLAASTAYSAKTGNFKIFEGWLGRSGAALQLGSEVTSITKAHDKYIITASDTPSSTYDAVIVAAPLPLTTIQFTNLPQPASFPPVAYVHLHVTLLTTTTPAPLPAYFHANDIFALPGTILTTAEAGVHPPFNSIRYQAEVQRDGATEYVVKMFSKAEIGDAMLATLFGAGTIGWVYRKEWDAYPYFPTRTDFPPVKIDEGLYYVNAMEGLWSTMETETVASRNVVDLLSTELFGAGLCGPGGAKGPATDGYVLGWDC